jgi:hypothetical protein
VCFGIAGTTVLACGTDACTESLLAPGILFGTSLGLFILIVALSRGAVFSSGTATASASAAFLIAAASALAALLWFGIWVSQFLGDTTNPWRDSVLAGPAQLIVLVNDFGSQKIRWEGGQLVAFFEISALMLAFLASSVALMICARALVLARGSLPPIALRRVLLKPVVLFPSAVTGLVLAAYVVGAIPAIASEAASSRAYRHLADATHQLTTRYTAALASYNASPKSLPDLESLGSASAVEYGDFDRSVVVISFPDSVRGDVNTLLRADSMAILASRNLSAITGQNVQTLIQDFDDARRAQSVAVEILFKDLTPPQQ